MLLVVALCCIAAAYGQAPAKAPMGGMAPASSMIKAPLATNRPLIFAHRGLSGLLPEHTLEAYCSAIEEGADFVEVGKKPNPSFGSQLSHNSATW